MILAAGPNGCVREVLIITAALAIQDPRERPADARDAADAMHRRFAEPGSDFLAFLTLWDYVREQQRQLSSSAFRRLCRREYLHYLRVREWQDVYSQLQQAARDIGILVGRHDRDDSLGRPGPADSQPTPPAASAARGRPARRATSGRYAARPCRPVHQSLLAGLLSHIGMQDADRKAGESHAGRPQCGRRPPARPGRVRRARAARGSRSSPTRRLRASRRSGSWRPS